MSLLLHRAAATAALLALSAVGCRLEHREPPPDTSAAEATADSTVDASGLSTGEELNSFRRDLHFDFTGDGRPEEIKVRARGERSDGLEVTLRIEDPKDSVIYYDRWSSAGYLAQSDARTRADRRLVRAVVQAELERTLADANIGSAVARPLADSGRTAAARTEALQHDVAESEWRRTHGIHRDSAIAGAAADSVTLLGRSRPDRARVRRILGELSATDRHFRYTRGGGDTVIVAWSASERRFVRLR
jgi:hypothetical protein